MPPGNSLTRQAHAYIRQGLYAGDIAIDATVGNGADLEFLCRAVAPGGRVYGFDIQAAALEKVRQQLAGQGLIKVARLFLAGHEEMADHIADSDHGQATAIMFNLGYLPGGDHMITTTAETTLAALADSIRLLAPGGRLSVLCYRGHPGGKEETRQVRAWSTELPQAFYTVNTTMSASPGPDTPLLVTVNKAAG